jgi:hypothetical protein
MRRSGKQLVKAYQPCVRRVRFRLRHRTVTTFGLIAEDRMWFDSTA